MPIVLIDANIEGHGLHIWKRMQDSEWRDFVIEMDVRIRTFRDVGLDPSSPDDIVWQSCQENGYYLLTSNRNKKSSDSLQATIVREGTALSLPVFTLPSPDRVYRSQVFLDRVIAKLLECLLTAESTRGAGRLFLP